MLVSAGTRITNNSEGRNVSDPNAKTGKSQLYIYIFSNFPEFIQFLLFSKDLNKIFKLTKYHAATPFSSQTSV